MKILNNFLEKDSFEQLRNIILSSDCKNKGLSKVKTDVLVFVSTLWFVKTVVVVLANLSKTLSVNVRALVSLLAIIKFLMIDLKFLGTT